MEQNRGPEYEFTATLTLFLTMVPKTYNGNNKASSTNVAEKSDYLPVEN
jgi:hypothetical protein